MRLRNLVSPNTLDEVIVKETGDCSAFFPTLPYPVAVDVLLLNNNVIALTRISRLQLGSYASISGAENVPTH